MVEGIFGWEKGKSRHTMQKIQAREGKAIRESLPHFLALQILRTRSAGAGYLERGRGAGREIERNMR